jgi:hypothetical protein
MATTRFKPNLLIRCMLLTAGILAVVVALCGRCDAAASADRRGPDDEQTSAPAVSQDGEARSPDALRPGDTAAGSIDVRHSKPGIALVFRGGSFKSQLSEELRYQGTWGPARATNSLQVLFCTWQA